jgi:hypothetical protein
LPKVEPALGHGLQRLAVELGQVTGHPFVDAVGKQQHFDALLAEDLEVRAVPGGGEGFRRDVVDLLLAILHPRHVVGQRDVSSGVSACVEAKRSSLAMRSLLAKSSPMPSLSTRPNSFQNLAYFAFSRLVAVGQAFEQAEHLLHAAATDRFDIARLLQDFTRNVERQIVGIDHSAYEAQIERHQLLGVVHDEDPAHVELDAVAGSALEKVERRARRDVEQLRIFLLALDTGMHMRQRILEIMRDVLVELACTARR